MFTGQVYRKQSSSDAKHCAAMQTIVSIHTDTHTRVQRKTQATLTRALHTCWVQRTQWLVAPLPEEGGRARKGQSVRYEIHGIIAAAVIKNAFNWYTTSFDVLPAIRAAPISAGNC